MSRRCINGMCLLGGDAQADLDLVSVYVSDLFPIYRRKGRQYLTKICPWTFFGEYPIFLLLLLLFIYLF